MRIGIDIDDTVSFTSKRMIEEAKKFDQEFLRGRGIKNKNTNSLIEMFYWDVYDLDRFLDYVRSGDFFLNVEIKEEADKYINKLFDEGHEIYFITRRKNSFRVRKLTKKWLKMNGFKYNKLFFGVKDKGYKCRDLGVDVFIDNDQKNIEEALEFGIDALLMVDEYNKRIRKLNKVNNWEEIYKYISGVK